MLAASLMAYLLCADELDPSATAELFDEAISAAAAAGDRDLEETLHTNAAVHELRRGDLPAARAQLESAIEIGESVYSGRMHYAFINLGWVLWQQGELDQARSLFVDALRNTRRSGDMSGVSYAILGIGCLLVAGEEWNEAAETLGAAQAARDAAGGQWEDPEGSYREACLERVRAALGDDGATARLAKGRSRLDSLMDELCRSQVPI